MLWGLGLLLLGLLAQHGGLMMSPYCCWVRMLNVSCCKTTSDLFNSCMGNWPWLCTLCSAVLLSAQQHTSSPPGDKVDVEMDTW